MVAVRYAVERPGERAGGGLMTRTDEGEDIVLDLLLRQTVGTGLLQQEGQEIVRHPAAVGLHPGKAHIHSVAHDGTEFFQHLLATDACHTWNPGRGAQQIHRIDATHAMQQFVDIVGEVTARCDDLTGKQSVREDGEGQLRHVGADIENCPGLAGTGIFARVVLRLAQHLAGKTLGMAGRENRSDGFSRSLPYGAFRGQKSVAQDGTQHKLANVGHSVIVGVIDQHMP